MASLRYREDKKPMLSDVERLRDRSKSMPEESSQAVTAMLKMEKRTASQDRDADAGSL
jgi:hypothetical protein